MVLTSHNQPGNTGLPTVSRLEDFAAPYRTFGGAGMEPMLASPEGGQPPLDPKSDLPETHTPATARFTKGSRMSTRCQPIGVHDTCRSAAQGPDLQAP